MKSVFPYQLYCACLLATALCAMAPSHATAAESKLSIVIDLKDGSRIVGTPLVSSIKLESSITSADIPLKSLDSAVFNADGETAALALNTGDKISGKLKFKTIKVKCNLGEIDLPRDKITRISVCEVGDVPVNVLLKKVSAPCSVRPPAAPEFLPANANSKYPFNSTVKTGSGGSASVQLAAGSCAVKGSSEITVEKPAQAGKLPPIALRSGGVEIKGDKLSPIAVEHDGIVFSGKSADFSVQLESQRDMTTLAASCTSGSLNVKGFHFDAVTGPGNASLTVSYSKDGEFCRFKNISGTVKVEVIDESGAAQTIDLAQSGIIKIWARTGGRGTTITYIVTSADGRVLQAITTSQ